MTPEQIATLKALVLADPVAAALAAIPDDIGLAAWLNEPTAKIVWRTSVSREELRRAVLSGAADLDNMTAGKRDSLLWVCSESINATDPGTRQAITDLTVKTSGAVAALLRPPLEAALRRPATRAESALAAGTGTTIAPATMTFEGVIDYALASTIRS